MPQCTREICSRLDHRFLLPMSNPHLELKESANSWEVCFQEKRYVFPRADVVELPVDNSTAELLAEYICGELQNALTAYPILNLHTMLVGVEEAPTQMAYYRVALHE